MITFNLPVRRGKYYDGGWPNPFPRVDTFDCTHPIHKTPHLFLHPVWNANQPIMYPRNLQMVYGLKQAPDDLVKRLWRWEDDPRPLRPVSAAM